MEKQKNNILQCLFCGRYFRDGAGVKNTYCCEQCAKEKKHYATKNWETPYEEGAIYRATK